MKKGIVQNYILNTCYQILILLTPTLTTPYISRVLGVEGIGIYSFTTSIIAYFVLFANSGTNIFGQREIAYLQEDIIKRSEVFFNLVIFRMICSLLSLGLFLTLINHSQFKTIFLIQSICILSVFVDISWFYQGMEFFQDIVIKNTAVKILGIISIFLFVKSPSDIGVYILVNVVSIFLGNVTMWSKIFRYVKFKKIKLSPFKYTKVIISLFIPQIAIQIYTVLDKTMIGLITHSAVENGYYEQAYKIIIIILSLVTSLGTVMIPRIANTYAQKDSLKMKTYLYRSYQFVWFLGIPIFFGLLAIVDHFIPWFLGKGYEPVKELVSILAFLVLSIGVSNVTGNQFFLATEQQGRFTFTVIVGAIINFTLNLFLISFFGAKGAACASVVAETIIAIIQLLLVRKVLDLKKIILSAKNYLISGLIMFLAVKKLGTILDYNLISFLFMVCVGSTLYIIFLLLLKDTFFVTNIKKTSKLFFGK